MKTIQMRSERFPAFHQRHTAGTLNLIERISITAFHLLSEIWEPSFSSITCGMHAANSRFLRGNGISRAFVQNQD
jgi:hypothetical protein